ncbi:hypothetical protein B0H13DRAFT_1852922 [Mycena leptocephala]|nr:hypothetical protein B0H13DRAFT_1852922 [Mycena leptocephala]
MFSPILLLAPFQLYAPHHQHWDNEEKEKLTSTKKKRRFCVSVAAAQYWRCGQLAVNGLKGEARVAVAACSGPSLRQTTCAQTNAAREVSKATCAADLTRITGMCESSTHAGESERRLSEAKLDGRDLGGAMGGRDVDVTNRWSFGQDRSMVRGQASVYGATVPVASEFLRRLK